MIVRKMIALLFLITVCQIIRTDNENSDFQSKLEQAVNKGMIRVGVREDGSSFILLEPIVGVPTTTLESSLRLGTILGIIGIFTAISMELDPRIIRGMQVATVASGCTLKYLQYTRFRENMNAIEVTNEHFKALQDYHWEQERKNKMPEGFQVPEWSKKI